MTFVKKYAAKKNVHSFAKVAAKMPTMAMYRKLQASIAQKAPEQKRSAATTQGAFLAQLNGSGFATTSSGHYLGDITPIPTIGSGYYNRVGRSVKLTEMEIVGQVFGQSAQTVAAHMKAFVIRVKGSPETTATFLDDLFYVGQWVTGSTGTIFDTSATFTHLKDTNYEVLAEKEWNVEQDAFSGGSDVSVKDFRIKMKFATPKEVVFVPDSTTVDSGQIFMLLLCNSGNYGANTAITGNTPVITALSGFNLNFKVQTKYIDN